MVTWRRIRLVLAWVFWLAVVYESNAVMGHAFIVQVDGYYPFGGIT